MGAQTAVVTRRAALVALILGAALVPLAVAPDGFFQTELPKRLAAALGVWALLALVIAVPGAAARSPRAPIAFALAAFCVWELAVWPFSPSPVQGLDRVLADLETLGLVALVLILVRGPAARWGLLAAFGLAGLAAALVGLMQDALAHPTMAVYASAPGRSAIALARPLFEGLRLDAVLQTDAPGSLFGHTNVAAEFVAAALFCHLAVLAALVRRVGGGRVLGLALLPTLLPPVFFLARSGSRAALGAVALVAVALALAAALSGARRAPLLGSAPLHLACWLLVGVTGAALLLAGSRLVEVEPRHGQTARSLAARLASAFDPEETTVAERLALFANTSAMAAANPVFGVGPGNFRIVYPEFARAARRHEIGRLTVRRQPEKPHDDYLHRLAETGTVGGILWLIAVAAGPLAGGVLLGRDLAARRRLRLDVLGALAACGVVLVTGLVAFPFLQTGTRLIFWCCAAALAGAARELAGRSATWRPGAGARAVLVGVLLGALFLAALHARARHEASAALGAARDLEVPARPAAAARAAHVARLRHVEAAAQRTPGDDAAGLFRAEALRRLGRFAAADRVLDGVIAAHPNLVNAWIARSGLALDRGRVEVAESAARRAVALDPDAPTAHLAMARVLDARARHAEAFQRLRLAHALEPVADERLEILLELARVAHRARQPVLTAMMLRRAEEAAPAEPRVLEARAAILEAQSPGSAPAREAWARLLERIPDHPEALMRIGLERLDAGRPDEALALLDRAFEASPESLVLLYHRARALAALDRLEDAVASVYACMKRSGRDGGDPFLWDRCYQLGLELQARLIAREEGGG